ncbi:polyketide cyclase [Streptomyces tateyamensis]|uniref:Polyketide cyclase n=1 Tax=Streptomyces tateyamensis TaxID=565073 RepID=A0A2V4MWF7_9ACTN|nr:SRPBCC family protein [Streptomyces tateyamensis]PYC65457.1 polyketide cyclase [Streptomyces tateyamensis]
MITVERTIIVERPAGEVLTYLADFGNTPAWDPGTESCTRLDSGPVAAGSRWLNVSRFRGRRSELNYRLETYEPGRLVFVGSNRTVTATDDITVRPEGVRTVLVYRAQLRFHGLARLAAPVLRAEFERLADAVAEQLPRAVREH